MNIIREVRKIITLFGGIWYKLMCFDNLEKGNNQQRVLCQKEILSKFWKSIYEKTLRLYLNQFIDYEKNLERLSEKQRDKNAKYAFKK